MALEALEHYTIHCADMAATRDFYRDALGLAEGFRPNFSFPGHWMYCGQVAVVHLVDGVGALHENRGVVVPAATSGALDHIAFRGRDAAETLARLALQGVAVRENRVPDIGLHQLFVRDPNGIMIEMNFREDRQ